MRWILNLLFMLVLPLHAQINEDIICAEKQHLQALMDVQKRSSTPNFHGYDIQYHRCFWSLNPKINSNIAGNVLFSFQVQGGNYDSLAFDLIADLYVDSVLYRGIPTKFIRKGNKVFVYKNGKWLDGERDSFTVFYQGNPASIPGGFGAYTYDAHATGPIIHTLSQPYGAPFWWPCKQTLSDKIDSIDIIVETARDFKVGSNGVLVKIDTSNASKSIHFWKHRHPVATYLVAIAVSNYAEFTDYAKFHGRMDSLPVVNYVFPQFLQTTQTEAKRVLPMLRLFDSLFIEYPFMNEKYGHAQFTWGGGMEHQTMSFMVNFSFDLTAHELAHQWFGDLVTCGSWNDLWLNEGFATYLTSVAYEYIYDKNTFRDKMRGTRADITADPNGSVKPKDTSSVNQLFNGRLTYRKGAWLLQMLRVRLGDSLFFEGCRQYLISRKANGFATTDQFRVVMESVSGSDLREFFKQWYEGDGFPNLKINWEQKGSILKVKIEQTPSNPSVPFWKITVPILFSNKLTGQQELKFFTPQKLTEEYVLNMMFDVDTAIFDPQVTVLAKAAIGGMNLGKIQEDPVFVFPNPSNGEIINVMSRNPDILSLEIVSLLGQTVQSSNFNLNAVQNVTMDVSSLSTGTYIVRIFTDNKVYLKKWIKSEKL